MNNTWYDANTNEGNYWSEGGLDVRNDYGGAYLFLVYIFSNI